MAASLMFGMVPPLAVKVRLETKKAYSFALRPTDQFSPVRANPPVTYLLPFATSSSSCCRCLAKRRPARLQVAGAREEGQPEGGGAQTEVALPSLSFARLKTFHVPAAIVLSS